MNRRRTHVSDRKFEDEDDRRRVRAWCYANAVNAAHIAAGVDPGFDDYPPRVIPVDELPALLDGSAINQCVNADTMRHGFAGGSIHTAMLNPDEPGIVGGRWLMYAKKSKPKRRYAKRGRPRNQPGLFDNLTLAAKIYPW